MYTALLAARPKEAPLSRKNVSLSGYLLWVLIAHNVACFQPVFIASWFENPIDTTVLATTTSVA